MPSIKAPQQPKQPSRKGKKAWRKNVDITAVQDGLEALREDVILGGPLAEKDSEDIFAVDTTSSEAITKKYKLQKPLKADEVLLKRSAVDSVDSRKRPISRLTDGILPVSKRLKSDWVSKKEVLRLKDVAKGGSQLTDTALEDDGSSGFDLWATNGDMEASISQNEYVPQRRAKVAPTTLQKPPTALTASGRPVKAVRNPDSGTSYNPSFGEWNNLFTREGQKEVEAEKARIVEAAVEAEKVARIAGAAEEKGGRTDDESAWEGFETETEEVSLTAKKRAERKTPAQRNKIKRRKEAERQARHEARSAMKQKHAAEIEAALRVATGNTIVPATVGDNNNPDDSENEQLRRKRLGNVAIPEKTLELILPDELQDSLRRLKPEGNLLSDRFRNLLVNGKVEARKPILQHKKKRVTYTEKWAYKDFRVEV